MTDKSSDSGFGHLFSSGRLPNMKDEATAEDNKSRPKWWTIVILNDDVTRVEFVRHVLATQYYCSESEIDALLRSLHTNGFCVFGSYTHEVAESKIYQTVSEAITMNYPLKIGVKPVEATNYL